MFELSGFAAVATGLSGNCGTGMGIQSRKGPLRDRQVVPREIVGYERKGSRSSPFAASPSLRADRATPAPTDFRVRLNRNAGAATVRKRLPEPRGRGLVVGIGNPGVCFTTARIDFRSCRNPTRALREHVQDQLGSRSFAGFRHPGRAGVPFLYRLSELATPLRAAIRQPSLWLGGEPDRRRRSLDRLRPVLCIPVSLPDAADVLSFRAVRSAESRA